MNSKIRNRKMKKVLGMIFCIIGFSTAVKAELPLGITPTTIILENENGGRFDGSSWNSQELKGKVHILFYVDPQERDLNRHVEFALNKTCLLLKVPTVAIINTAAAWYPDSTIISEVKKREKWAHNTTFIFDKKKSLVKNWNLKDDSYDVVVFDVDGKVIFSKDGELSTVETNQMIDIITETLHNPDVCKNKQLADNEVDDLIMIIKKTKKAPYGIVQK